MLYHFYIDEYMLCRDMTLLVHLRWTWLMLQGSCDVSSSASRDPKLTLFSRKIDFYRKLGNRCQSSFLGLDWTKNFYKRISRRVLPRRQPNRGGSRPISGYLWISLEIPRDVNHSHFSKLFIVNKSFTKYPYIS